MGSFNVADCITGLAINAGDPVVTILLSRRMGGYPDAMAESVLAATSPTSIFEPMALPVRGTYDDCGTVVPLPGDLGAELACEMLSLPSWSDLQTWIKDIPRQEKETPRIRGDRQDRPVRLGQAIMHAAT